jgi:hypothetical protein
LIAPSRLVSISSKSNIATFVGAGAGSAGVANRTMIRNMERNAAFMWFFGAPLDFHWPD